jgi:hypothetical protein
MTNIRRLATAALTAGAIVVPTAAYATPLLERFFAAGAGVNARSAGVAFTDVAREVAPDTFQIDPRAVQGRRLILGATEAGKRICVGVWRKSNCYGVFIEKDVPQAP